MDNKKTAVYIRIAIQGNEKVELEKEEAIRICQDQGWDIYDTYIDNGFSGTSMDRPGLKKMLEDARNKKFNILFVNGVYMLSRNPENLLNISRVLNDNDITLMSIEHRQLIKVNHERIMLEVEMSNIVIEELKEKVLNEQARLLEEK